MHTAKDRLGLLLIAGSFGLIALVAIVGIMLDLRRPRIDSVTGCIIGVPPSAETAVVIDLTDPISPSQRAEMLEYFRQLEAVGLRANERLTLWTLAGSREGLLRRRFCRCRPDVEVSALFGNKQFALAKGESLFAAPLRRELAGLPIREDAATTPLLEAIRAVCDQPEFEDRRVPHRLVLVTNLEQNSSLLSAYADTLDLEAFAASAAFARVRSDLRGVEVEVLYAPHGRAAVSLTSSLQDFWRHYLLVCGAASVQVRRL